MSWRQEFCRGGVPATIWNCATLHKEADGTAWRTRGEPESASAQATGT